jgi:leader peptidase (prepilin peptidase) / N-methyltransferase
MILSATMFQLPAAQLSLAVASFVLGACVGSFLNVMIYRVPLGISVADPKRSFCPSCRYQIPMWHNIPIFSWLWLRGKCANCGAPISPRYVLVEVMTAFMFLMTALWFRDEPWRVIPLWIFLSLCLAATYIDIDHMIIPDQITYGGAAAGVVCSLVFPWMIVPLAPRWVNLLHSLAGVALGLLLVWIVVRLGKLAFGRLKYGFKEPTPWEIHQPENEPEPIIRIAADQHLWTDVFFRKTDRLRMTCQACRLNGEEQGEGELVLTEDSVEFIPTGGAGSTRPLEDVQHMAGLMTKAVVPREAMGLGDVKFMGLVGAFLGWKGILFTLFAGSIIGSVISVAMIAIKRREWAARLPFGPYLALGAAIWVFLGPQLVDLYFQLSGVAPGR